MSTAEQPDVDLLELAYPYAMDAVTERERVDIERLRAGADRLTAAQFDHMVAEIHDTLAGLTVVDASPAPPELEDRLLRALDRLIDAACGRGVHHRPARRRFLGSMTQLERLTAAAAVVIAVGAGTVGIANRYADHAPAQAISASIIDEQPDVLTRNIAMAGGEVQVRSSAALSLAAISFQGTAAPGEGLAYQVWLVPLGESPRSAAILDTLPDHAVVAGFRSVDTLAVTIEPAGGSPLPTTTPIASLNLG
ncbi:anti-sigma factor [Nocardia jejuensis]|uniref:anti-sigma factor n=1 Tax=Nocardia jejuensis TaxID=328049 RepID=UPI000830D0F0|nr:anti-sigma factor [Nocardia jejuensis]